MKRTYKPRKPPVFNFTAEIVPMKPSALKQAEPLITEVIRMARNMASSGDGSGEPARKGRS